MRVLGVVNVRPALSARAGTPSRLLPFSSVGLLLLVLLTGCGGGDDSSTGADPTPPGPPVPTTVTLSSASASLLMGETLQFTATVADQTGATMTGAAVTWRSSADSVASVSSTGLVTGVAGGAATITATSGSASGTRGLTVVDPPGPYRISTSLDVVGVAIGTRKTIAVAAVDVDTLAPVAFQAQLGAGNCVSMVSDNAKEISITGVTELGTNSTPCEQLIVITAPGMTKTITARPYSPATLALGSGLYMRYTNQFDFVWNDVNWHESGLTPSTAWHPVLPGWFPVGDHLQTDYSNLDVTGTVPAVMLRDLSVAQNNLAQPTDYQRIWNNFQTNTFVDRQTTAAFWRPVCPAGFVALGSVATTGAKPPLDRVRCVSNRFTTPAKREASNAHYTDTNSGSDRDLTLFRAAAPSDPTPRLDGRATLWARSHFGCATNSIEPACDVSLLNRDPRRDFGNLLLVPMDVMQKGNDTSELRTDRPFAPGQKSSSRIRVPFTLVPSEDPTCGTPECAAAAQSVAGRIPSPFVYLERSNDFVPLTPPQDFSRAPGEISYQLQKCFSQALSDSFTRTVGLSITVTAEAEFAGVTGSVAVGLSEEFGWTQTRAVEFGTCSTVSNSYSIEQGPTAQIVSQRESFRAVSEAGVAIGTPFALDAQDTVQLLLWFP